MDNLMDIYSNEEFIKIIKESYSYRECLKNLGYQSYSGCTMNQVKEKINKLNIDISHFKPSIRIKRNEENIFIKNSTVSQKVLRHWYKKGNYSEYKCSICGQEPFWNGKELTLILDHINGFNTDDRLENLRWVCPNCNYQLDTTNGKNVNHGNHKVNYCLDCGKAISLQSLRCLQCDRIKKSKEHKMLLSRDELKKLIRIHSFVKIGKMYGVTDNAVRKWCDKYSLPKKATEIEKYTNEQWDKI